MNGKAQAVNETATHAAASQAEPPRVGGDRRTPALVGVIWALLVINTLGSQGSTTLVPIPRPVVQMVTMGAVLLAFALALLLNPRVRVRPSAYLLLLTLLLVVSVVASAQLESGFGALFRCARLALFIGTLWLLTRWWNDAMAFVRNHVRALCAVLLTVAAGLAIAPGMALPPETEERLVGVLWPLPAPLIGQYAAVVTGLAVVLWLGRRTDGRSVLLITGPAMVLLMLSHTRTAMVGLLAGLLVAGLSLVTTHRRARLSVLCGVTGGALAMALFGEAVRSWLERGQSAEDIANFTGRAKVWDALLDAPRPLVEQLFGVGLTNKSFDGLPIDSSWLAVYHDQGVIGVALVAAFLGTLVVAAALRPPSIERACAIFLIVYCLLASFTEAGLGDASAYLLNLTVAAALLSRDARQARVPGHWDMSDIRHQTE